LTRPSSSERPGKPFDIRRMLFTYSEAVFDNDSHHGIFVRIRPVFNSQFHKPCLSTPPFFERARLQASALANRSTFVDCSSHIPKQFLTTNLIMAFSFGSVPYSIHNFTNHAYRHPRFSNAPTLQAKRSRTKRHSTSAPHIFPVSF